MYSFHTWHLQIPSEWLNFACEVIAHYDPKGSCARGHPSTPYAIGKPDGDAIGISTNEKRKVMAKTSINVRPCNIGSAERHNLRSKELDYIRPELSHRNEQWSEMKIADVLEDIREKYRQHTGQSMQKKATPIREGVVVIEDGTTLRQLQDFAGRLEERFGIHTFQIYTHKDEGASVWDGNAETWKPNYHAHMIFDWTDGETGRTRKLNKQDMAEMQTILAECLGMERGISSDRKHLSAIQYKNMVEAEKAVQIEKECRQMENERNAIEEKVKQAGEKLEDTQKKLKEAAAEIKVEKLKGAAADTGTALLKAGTTVIDATASLFNSGKVKRKNRRRKAEADNRPVPLYGKRQREHRGTPGNGCREQRYPAPAHRKRDNLFRIPVRPGAQEKAPSQGRENRHSQKQGWQHDHLAERFSLQGVLQAAMAKAAKGFRNRQRQGIPFIVPNLQSFF